MNFLNYADFSNYYMNILEIWLFFIVLGLSLAAPLGPVNLEMIKQSFHPTHNHGFLLAIITGIGAITGDFLIALSVLTLGVELILDVFSNTSLKLILLLFNVGLLSYLSVSAIRETYKENQVDLLNINSEDYIKHEKSNEIANGIKQYGTGFSIVVSSPWSYIWWVSFGSLIILSGVNVIDTPSRLVIILMFLSGIFLWIISFTLLLLLGKKFANQNILNWITRLSSVLLLIFALYFLIDAINITIDLI